MKRSRRVPHPLVYEGTFSDVDPEKVATWMGRPIPAGFLRRRLRITIEVVDS